MKLSERAKDIVRLLYAKNLDLARGDDEQRRTLTRKIAEQICFEFGPQWGTKSADKTRPASKDAIAFFDGTTLLIWDWQDGTTRKPGAGLESDGEDVTGQHFIPVVPTNHLGGVTVPEPPEQPDYRAELALLHERVRVLTDLYNELQGLYKTLTQLHEQETATVKALEARVNELEQPVEVSTSRWFGHKHMVRIR